MASGWKLGAGLQIPGSEFQSTDPVVGEAVLPTLDSREMMIDQLQFRIPYLNPHRNLGQHALEVAAVVADDDTGYDCG